jgi:hypothetical protein
MKKLLGCLVVFGAVLSATPRVEATYPPCWQVCCAEGPSETICTLMNRGTSNCAVWWSGYSGSPDEPACP